MSRYTVDNDHADVRWHVGWDRAEHTYFAQREWANLPRLLPDLDRAGDDVDAQRRATESFIARYDNWMIEHFGHHWHGYEDIPQRGNDVHRYFLDQLDLERADRAGLRALPEPNTLVDVVGAKRREVDTVDDLAARLSDYGVTLAPEMRAQLDTDRVIAEVAEVAQSRSLAVSQSRSDNFPVANTALTEAHIATVTGERAPNLRGSASAADAPAVPAERSYGDGY